MGRTTEVLDLGSLESKFLAFGFDVVEINGHDTAEIESALVKQISRKNGQPKAIIAKTKKGAGVSFMEMNNSWHYTRLDDATYASAMQEVKENF
jgi:transketolase